MKVTLIHMITVWRSHWFLWSLYEGYIDSCDHCMVTLIPMDIVYVHDCLKVTLIPMFTTVWKSLSHVLSLSYLQWGPWCCSLPVKPVLNWAYVCSPNIRLTVRRTMIRFLIEPLVRRTWFGQFDEFYFSLSQLACNAGRCKLRPELVADAQQTARLKM